ncbi:ATP-binding protein [Anaerovorax odorimutans]|uniref:Stage 0 sporulation protein A homolog n=1 Tax=Anaerovorax odorimutans TaxID=109327 RepID=A0ABT1RPH4_9FIRM|nr:ATP-binding protein [Anaerovorax odorimutans]MCQ4637092.1 ATP-binding protein [Anaerovorax odorimutans]
MDGKNLVRILDSMTETGIYVIKQDSHELLYFNRRVKEVSPEAQLGMKCHELWEGSCENCPLTDLGDRDSNHTIQYNDPFGEIIDTRADRALWDGHIPAFVITVSPHKLNFEEEQGQETIEEMYRQSLVTVFGECIIANLTADYYVNCQKDTLWTEIPVSGHFDNENRKYAKITIHPDDLAAFEANFTRDAMIAQFAEGKEQISKRLRRLMDDGVYHMVEFTAAKIRQTDESQCWCVLIFHDVNTSYLQEQRRNVEMSQLAAAARLAFEKLFAVNLTGNSYHRVERVGFPARNVHRSGRFDRLIESGVSTVDSDFRDEFIRKFSRTNILQAFANGEKKVEMELRQTDADGVWRWKSIQIVQVESSYTEDVLGIAMINDIDEVRRRQEENLEKEKRAKALLEETLEKAEAANRAKSQFLSQMSHDIRTPMNAIIGMTSLARIHMADTEKLEDYLQKIEASGTHLMGLINEVLEVNKIESGATELENTDFSLETLLQQVENMLQQAVQAKRQRLTVDLQEGTHLYVSGDEQKLRQILVNIVENASKYTPDFGDIQLTLRELKKEEERMGTYQFVIKDNGIGMTKEYMEHIFEPFSRANDPRIQKISGTGLGLTIVHNLVSMMGGEIEAESEYEKGTSFTITLCLEKKGALRQEYFEESTAAVGKTYIGMRALLVDDNELNRQIAAEMLELLGVTVEIAENGQEAVDAVVHNVPMYYDLVFMDIQMPVMDGYEAVRAIRGSGKERIDELPILAMTADAFLEDIKKSRLAGMDGHITKPISIDALKSALEKCRSWKLKHLE